MHPGLTKRWVPLTILVACTVLYYSPTHELKYNCIMGMSVHTLQAVGPLRIWHYLLSLVDKDWKTTSVYLPHASSAGT